MLMLVLPHPTGGGSRPEKVGQNVGDTELMAAIATSGYSYAIQ